MKGYDSHRPLVAAPILRDSLETGRATMYQTTKGIAMRVSLQILTIYRQFVRRRYRTDILEFSSVVQPVPIMTLTITPPRPQGTPMQTTALVTVQLVVPATPLSSGSSGSCRAHGLCPTRDL